MIVDMIRNDLGKIAETGSVNVPHLYEIEKYDTVWQMTSTVTANSKSSYENIFKALFPCASITGAPKVRTMQIISELEKSPRKIYTGTIGYISPKNRAQFNVAIRTALINKKENQLEYGLGGGIVWDSVDTKEYEESILKSKILFAANRKKSFELLESILWDSQNGYFLLYQHLERLYQSAQYFEFKVDLKMIENKLIERSNSFEGRKKKVRLLLNKKGKIQISVESIDEKPKNLTVRFAHKNIDSSDVFLFHKTTNRIVYEQSKNDFPEFDDVILWNEKKEITESCIANIVIVKNGKYLTPPVSCGLLNGVFRSYLLSQGKIQEQVITIDDFRKAEKVFLINSVRKWQKTTLQD